MYQPSSLPSTQIVGSTQIVESTQKLVVVSEGMLVSGRFSRSTPPSSK